MVDTKKMKRHISTDKDAAKNLYDKLTTQTPDMMVIYTDGSGINEQARAAAYNRSLDKTTHKHLGKQTQYNVYSMELTALDPGITQWQSGCDDFPNYHIYTDSQAAATSIQKPQRQSG